MKVKELVEALSKVDQDLEVYVNDNEYGPGYLDNETFNPVDTDFFKVEWNWKVNPSKFGPRVEVMSEHNLKHYIDNFPERTYKVLERVLVIG